MTNSFDDLFAKALAFKEQGNAFMKSGEYSKAAYPYHMVELTFRTYAKPEGGDPVMSFVPSQTTPLTDEQKKRMNDLKVVSLNNLALCLLNQQKFSRVVSVAQDVLNIDSNNTKARLRRCMA
eukprot:PhF_6_TR21912/c0_g1_i2/m.31125